MVLDWNQIRIPALAIIGVGVAGYVGITFGSHFDFDPNATTKITERLQQMVLFSVVVERVVEVYLGLSGTNGPDRNNADDPNAGNDPATASATIASLTVGILLAICGVRILDAAGTYEDGHGLADTIWTGVDIMISGGLMAGGAYIFHEIAETITGGIRGVGDKIKPGGSTVTDKTTDQTVIVQTTTTETAAQPDAGAVK